jgi:hypothetical protein
MNASLSIERTVQFGGRGRKKELEARSAPVTAGRVPRVSRLMALAIKLDGLIQSGAIASPAEAARLGHVTRARMSQILGLLNLAPDIQSAVLFLPLTEQGRHPIILKDLLPITQVPDWRKQRRLWRQRIALGFQSSLSRVKISCDPSS